MSSLDYEQRQKEVDRVRRELDQDETFTPKMLGLYADHQPEELRRDLYALFWRTGTGSGDRRKRSAIVSYLVGRVSVENPMLQGQLLKWLQDFHRIDFDQDAAESLKTLPWNNEYGQMIIRLMGIADPPGARSRLKLELQSHPLMEGAGYYDTNAWASLLALARLGDRKALNQVIEHVRNEPDIVVRATILFADLGYTMQPAAFDVLRDYVNSDRRLPAVKTTVPGRLEASRAAEVFSKYIADFPIKDTDFTELQTLQAREWVNGQTTWQFK